MEFTNPQHVLAQLLAVACFEHLIHIVSKTSRRFARSVSLLLKLICALSPNNYFFLCNPHFGYPNLQVIEPIFSTRILEPHIYP